MTPGDIVRYTYPSDGEEHLTFIVREIREDRVAIESRDFPDWRFAPVEVVHIDEVMPCES